MGGGAPGGVWEQANNTDQQLDTMAVPQATQGDTSRTSISERALGN
jgi:hypothetical protein